MGNLFAQESLLSYFAEMPFEMYFENSWHCRRLPNDIVQKYLLEVMNDELFNSFNGNEVEFYAISKE